MCGIAGFIQRGPDPEALCRGCWPASPTGVPTARGPGATPGLAGRVRSPAAGDHRRRRRHPADGERGRPCCITYNGEIYNFLQLRPELEQAGHRFRDAQRHRGDPSPLRAHGTAAWPRWTACSPSRSGTPGRSACSLARDRCGIKPLYYAELPDGGLVFASELGALLAHGGVDRELGVEGLASYFFSDYVHPPFSMLRRVKKLPPGHTVVWQDGRLGRRAPSGGCRPRGPPPRERATLADELWAGTGRAVKAQLVADVPVGIFLSGGIDSSCVATRGRRGRAHEGVLDRLRERHLRRVGLRPDGGQSAGRRVRSGDARRAHPAGCARSGARPARRADGRSVVPADVLPAVAPGGPPRQGGRRRRRWRRAVGRVPDLPGPRVRGPLRGSPPGFEPASRAGPSTLPIDDRYQSLEWKLRRFTGRWDDDPVVRHLRWMSSVDLPDLGRAIPARGAFGPRRWTPRCP